MSVETAESVKNTVENFVLEVEERVRTGKLEIKRMRKDGIAPGVLYSGGDKPRAIKFLLKDFVHLAEKAKTSQIFTLKSKDSSAGDVQAIVKEIQLNCQKDTVQHVDFQLLSEKTPVSVKVPLRVTGEAPGVKNQGGILTTQCREVTIVALPKDIPSEITVSVSGLKLGERIRTGEVNFPDGVTLKSNPEETVANVVSGRAARLAGGADAEGGEAAAEGAAA